MIDIVEQRPRVKDGELPVLWVYREVTPENVDEYDLTGQQRLAYMLPNKSVYCCGLNNPRSMFRKILNELPFFHRFVDLTKLICVDGDENISSQDRIRLEGNGTYTNFGKV